AARANARANGVAVDVTRADVLVDSIPPAEVAVANIALAVVERLAARTPTPLLVASGYSARERPRLAGWRHELRRDADGWAADLYERQVVLRD
ncbi:MAG: hypothetical protein M3304_06595, partial [Actinomycetota bacterium]|nr:hypothetical protein [Actinomycetota bacterium]